MAPNDSILPGPSAGFPPGYSTTKQAQQAVTATAAQPEMDFGMRRMAAGEIVAATHASETARVLLHGEAEMEFAGRREAVLRRSLFDEAPSALDVGPATPVAIRALTATGIIFA